MKPQPFFSIVVPTFRRPAPLCRLLESLVHLKYPATRFQVIVVDDGGGLAFEPILGSFSETLHLVVLSQSNQGPASARNLGARRSEGEILAFIDDDCEADALWLTELSRGFEASGNRIGGGRTINALPMNPYAAASHLLIEYLYCYYNPEFQLGAFFPTNNFAVPRTAFLQLGGFEPVLRFGEDREFCHRWALAGYRFQTLPHALVYHRQCMDFSSFLRLHFCYGRGSFHYRRKVVERGSTPGRLSPISFYARLVLAGLRSERSPRGLRLSGLLLLSQAANTVGFVSGAVKNVISP